MSFRKLLPIVASATLVMPLVGTVPVARAQDATASVLAERAELDKALAAKTEDRIPLLEKFIADHSQSLLIDQAREALVRTHATIGEVGLKNGNPKAAAEAFTKALDSAGDKISDRLFTQVIWQMPVVMASAGYRFDAIELMKTFEPRFNDQAPRLIQIGYFYVSIESPLDAVRVLQRAVDIAPDDHRAHNTLGTAYILSLRLDDAANEFQKAIDLEPKEEYAYASLANLRRAFGNPTDAIALYQKQLEIKPDDPETYGGLAIAYLLNDDDQSAAQALAKALSLSPGNFRLYTTLGYLYVARGKYDKAREMVDISMKYEPRFAWTHIVLGNLLLGQRQYTQAVQAFAQAQNYGDFPTLHFELAKAYMVNDQFEQAIDQLNASFDITDDGQFETRLGDVLDLRSSRLDLLLDRERQAVLFLNVQPTTDTQYRLAESLARIGHFLELVPDPEIAPAETPAAPAPVPPMSEPVLTQPINPDSTETQPPVGAEPLPEPSPETGPPPPADDTSEPPVEMDSEPPLARFVRRVVFQEPAPESREEPARPRKVVTTDPQLKPADAPLVFRPRRLAAQQPNVAVTPPPGTEPATEPATEPGTEPATDPTTDPAAAGTDIPPGTAPGTEEPPVVAKRDPNGRPVDPAIRDQLMAAINEFVGVDDGREAFRKLWIARRLADKGILLDRAKELAQQALDSADVATELDRSMRDMLDADRETRRAVLTARAHDTLGWVMLKRGETEDAIAQLTMSVDGSAKDPDFASRLWHLGVAKQEAGNDQEALDLYLRAYNPAAPSAPVRKQIIQQLYVKVHGSTDGLDQKLPQ